MLVVRDVMESRAVSITDDAPAAEAARLMFDRHINSLVVCRGGRVVGIVTPRDLMRRHVDAPAGIGGAVRVADVMTPDPVTIAPHESFTQAAALMNERGVRHLPVTEQGRLVGILSMRDLLRHRTAELEETVRAQTAELASKNAALEERDRINRHHIALAARIQEQLHPTSPLVSDPFTVAVVHRPFDRVSGDYYDVDSSGDHLGILVADASGHGIAAAFVSVMARAIFRASNRRQGSPAEMLREMNEQLPPLIEAEHFITMCFAVLERRTLRMTYAIAGHPAPLWRTRRHGDVHALEGSGHMIGIMRDATFEERTVQLAPGDVVLFFSDGLLDAPGRGGARFGRERIASVLDETRDRPIAGAVAAIDSVLQAFATGPGGDDVTIVGVEVTGHADGQPAG
jgi:serine phosphatase RsbU (regulator of sigma subunit)